MRKAYNAHQYRHNYSFFIRDAEPAHTQSTVIVSINPIINSFFSTGPHFLAPKNDL